MRRPFRALGRLLLAGCCVLATGCTGTGNSSIALSNEDDSLAYAVSMVLSEGFPAIMSKEGVDSATVDDFVRGMRAVFPVEETPEARAYLAGVYAAIEAAGMLEKVDESVYPDEKDKKVSRRLFLEGLVASATGNAAMGSNEAEKYYNQKIFRARSEKFIASNKKRSGVASLRSGVQYKIETMGKGPKAVHGDTVACIYKGMYPNGAVFATSRGQVAGLAVDEVVPGLAEVFMTLPAGTRCMAYIPWQHAYGAKGTSSIAPYSALVYDLEIVEVKKGLQGK